MSVTFKVCPWLAETHVEHGWQDGDDLFYCSAEPSPQLREAIAKLNRNEPPVYTRFVNVGPFMVNLQRGDEDEVEVQFDQPLVTRDDS